MNRKKNGSAALIMARRIAAALNIGVSDFGFYWVTGLTADGSIVVANSYGLAYVPEGVNLPDHVTMATADETLPPQERAKWATYPILAIQGWAQAHDQKLRAVIATEEQFASFDPGTAKIVLRPDDIPESGKMEGRSRLEVIAPSAAARLASVPNAELTELLPPAPADTAAPEDKSNVLWFEPRICRCAPSGSKRARRTRSRKRPPRAMALDAPRRKVASITARTTQVSKASQVSDDRRSDQSGAPAKPLSDLPWLKSLSVHSAVYALDLAGVRK